MKKIYEELSRIQRELKAPKNLYNKFGNYAYRNAEGILEAVKPLLNGLVLIINDEPVLIGDRYYIRATVRITDGEDEVSAVAFAREDETKKGMDGCQITGACSSYARKYALNALLMIDDAKDSDDDALSPKNPANKPEPIKPRPADPAVPAGKVETAGKLPQTPEIAFLTSAMRQFREDRGISAEENKRIFNAQKAALIAAGLAPDKRTDQYTLAELEALVNAMYTHFTTTGTELKGA